jgi:hypothetical protein
VSVGKDPNTLEGQLVGLKCGSRTKRGLERNQKSIISKARFCNMVRKI